LSKPSKLEKALK